MTRTQITMAFANSTEFEAMRQAEAWCESLGYSVGRMQGGEPRGILFGDFDIQKWRNLNAKERAALVGTMTGNMRNGPVCVAIDREEV